MILLFLVLLVQEINAFSAKMVLLVRKNSASGAKILLLVLGNSANSANSANKDDEFE